MKDPHQPKPKSVVNYIAIALAVIFVVSAIAVTGPMFTGASVVETEKKLCENLTIKLDCVGSKCNTTQVCEKYYEPKE